MLVKVFDIGDGTYIRLMLEDIRHTRYLDPDIDVEKDYYSFFMSVYWSGKRAKRGGGRMFSARVEFSAATGKAYKSNNNSTFLKNCSDHVDEIEAWVAENRKALLKFGLSNPFKKSAMG